jgi:hypothetical protein
VPAAVLHTVPVVQSASLPQVGIGWPGSQVERATSQT